MPNISIFQAQFNWHQIVTEKIEDSNLKAAIIANRQSENLQSWEILLDATYHGLRLVIQAIITQKVAIYGYLSATNKIEMNSFFKFCYCGNHFWSTLHFKEGFQKSENENNQNKTVIKQK